jgi:hypothetical protein
MFVCITGKFPGQDLEKFPNTVKYPTRESLISDKSRSAKEFSRDGLLESVQSDSGKRRIPLSEGFWATDHVRLSGT